MTSSGETRWIEISTTPLETPDGALVSFEDATEEQDAARRADELSRVLEATKDLVGILSADGSQLIWLNETLEGFLPREALGTPFVHHLDNSSQALYVATALPEVHSSGTWSGELTILGHAASH